MKSKTKHKGDFSNEINKSKAQVLKGSKRRASIYITENQNNSVDVTFFDGDVRDGAYGKLRSFDSIALCTKLLVYGQVEEFIDNFHKHDSHREAILSVRWDNAPKSTRTQLKKALEDNADMAGRLNKVRNIVLNIKTGKGGSEEKDTAYDIQKKLIEALTK